MARPRTHDAATAEALLAAAARLLREGGVEAISVRAAADEIGTSFRAVYALFGSKQALVDALAERGYRGLAERVGSLPESDDAARDLVRAGVEGFRPFAMTEPEIFRLTFERVSAEVLQHDSVSASAGDAYRALARWVGRARAAGLVHPGRSDASCVLMFHATCQGLASCELSALPPPEGPGMWPMMDRGAFDAVWHEALTALVAGFERPPAPTA